MNQWKEATSRLCVRIFGPLWRVHYANLHRFTLKVRAFDYVLKFLLDPTKTERTTYTTHLTINCTQNNYTPVARYYLELIVRAYGVIHIQGTVASAEINTIIISLVFDKSCDTMDVTFAECVRERNNIMLRIDVIQHPNVQIRGNCATRKLLYLHGQMEKIWCFQNSFLLIIWFHTIKLFTSNVGTFCVSLSKRTVRIFLFFPIISKLFLTAPRDRSIETSNELEQKLHFVFSISFLLKTWSVEHHWFATVWFIFEAHVFSKYSACVGKQFVIYWHCLLQLIN